MTPSALSIGVIGAGRIGRIHADTLARRIPGARLAGVTDINAEAAHSLAEALSTRVYPDAEALLADETIGAVAICSATDTHAGLIAAAAQAGKHIFCEKPIASDLTAIDKALAAVESAGVTLMIGFNRRFDPNHQRIKRAIDSGEIGTPHLLHIISRDPGPPPIEYVKVSGGMFFDMSIHDFDMARFLLGEVVEVYAAGGVLVDPAIGAAGDIDTAVITLKFASGAIGTIDNSRRAVYGYDQRVEVFGSDGSASSGNWYADAVTVSTARGVGHGVPLNFFLERYLTSYQNELAAFVETVTHGAPNPVSGADGRAPVVIAAAALRSLRENRPVRVGE